MANAFAGIEIGKRSIMTHSQQIQTAGHNISNADTEGYSRQRVQVKTFDPLYRPDLSRAGTSGQIGQGTSIESITRLRDEMLDQRIVAQNNQESYWGTREKYYVMIEQIYNEPHDISVRTNMDKFWQSWQELSMYPENKAARQAVVTRGESLTESISQRFKSLSGIGTLINSDIEANVKQINDYAKQIAEINSEINYVTIKMFQKNLLTSFTEYEIRKEFQLNVEETIDDLTKLNPEEKIRKIKYFIEMSQLLILSFEKSKPSG